MKKIILILSLGASLLGGCVYLPDDGPVARPQGGRATASARRDRRRRAIAELLTLRSRNKKAGLRDRLFLCC